MALSRLAIAAFIFSVAIFLFHSRAGTLRAVPSARITKPVPAIAKRTLSSSPAPAHAAPSAGRAEGPAAVHAQVLSDLARSSRGRWQITWNAHSATRMYGARLPLQGAPAEAGGEFLARYGSLLGISPRDARLEQIRSIDGNTQLIYSQEIDGLPVFSSRVSMVLDSENNLIYLSSTIFDGQASAREAVSAHVAARAAMDGLGDYSRRRMLEDPGISLEEMQSRGRLGYRLVGNAIGLVYEFSVAAHVPPLDLEIFVDGMSGELAEIRNLVKNK